VWAINLSLTKDSTPAKGWRWIRVLNPLASLSSRIFLWFWLTLLLIAVISFVVLQQWARPYDIAPLSAQEQQLLNSQSEEMTRYFNVGMSPLQAMRYGRIRFGLDLYLVDPNFRLMGSPQPEQMELYMIGSLLESETPMVGIWNQARWLGAAPIDYRGNTYRLLIRMTDPPARTQLIDLINDRITWTLLALLVSAILSLALANSLSKPLRLLRSASRDLARGQLEARVAQPVVRRADDIGQLGHDFNHMAERIQGLIQAQQRLLSNISHELRSPLTRLQIALGIARQSTSNPDPQLDRIEHEAGRLETMIAQLLQLSRLENRLQHMQFTQLNLNELLRGIIEDAEFEAESNHRTLEFDDTIDQVWIRADALLLGSAIENVVRNAIKYSAQTISISLEHTESQLVITVSDDGPGVAAEELSRLFDPFYRASNTLQGGSGLGLSITQQAMEAHQGWARAQNRESGGFMITLCLPITCLTTAPEAEQSTPTGQR
jgi:two-component system sensor histidine kinase CpxA